MININEVRERLKCDAEDFTERGLAIPTANDIRAILADHARLQAMAEELGRFRSLARWVSNSAGHGINSNQRRLGEELLVLIDAAMKVRP